MVKIWRAWLVLMGVCAVTLLVLLGLWFSRPVPRAVVPSRSPALVCVETGSGGEVCGRHLELLAYTDPYGSPAPGGAAPLDTSPAGSAGSSVGSAVDGLSQVPFALLIGLSGVLVLWWVVSFVFGFFQ
jgi:hypothetical protein